jgi:hypothetical protein
MSDERYLSVLIEWAGHTAHLKEILLPVVLDLQQQISEGKGSYFAKKGLPKIKAAFCRPASLFWTPGITMDEARWAARGAKPVRSYLEMEEHMMKFFTQSMDIEEDDEFLIGNWFDSSIYYVSKSQNGAWRIPSKRAVGPFSSNAF